MALIGRGVVLIRDAKLSVIVQRLHMKYRGGPEAFATGSSCRFRDEIRGTSDFFFFSVPVYTTVGVGVVGWSKG